MPFEKIELRPGIYRDATDYTNTGGWYDCNNVRFRAGKPEKIGGWQKFTNDSFSDIARKLLRFRTLKGDIYTAIGTNFHVYLEIGEALLDITPYKSKALGLTDPFTTTSGSNEVLVTDPGHDIIEGDYVFIENASAFDVYAANDVNGEKQVTEVVSTSQYKVQFGVSAGSTTSGGGTVDIYRLISPGLDTVVFGTGWGADAWGAGGWGEAADQAAEVSFGTIRLWSFDNYGEDLIGCASNNGIYYWDATNVNDRMFPISELPGAVDTPTIATSVIVSDRDRHVLAFGTNPIGESAQDPLLIRWSDQENAGDWRPTTTNTSGSIRLSSGSRIVSALSTRAETLVWTETTTYSLRYIGGVFVFSLESLAENTTCAGQNSPISVSDVVYWMGQNTFYVYAGQVREIPCPVRDKVFLDINNDQRDKIHSGANVKENEVFWFYPSLNSNEVDKYVTYNYRDNIWYYGTLARTAWIDRGLAPNPIAAGLDGYLYYQDFGTDDGSTNPPGAIDAFIESSPIEIGNGDRFTFIKRIIPDVSFRESLNGATMNIVLSARNEPGSAVHDSETSSITKSATIPVEQYTNEVWVRLRGRSFVIRAESNTTNSRWRLGTPRVEVRTDGRR